MGVTSTKRDALHVKSKTYAIVYFFSGIRSRQRVMFSFYVSPSLFLLLFYSPRHPSPLPPPPIPVSACVCHSGYNISGIYVWFKSTSFPVLTGPISSLLPFRCLFFILLYKTSSFFLFAYMQELLYIDKMNMES